VVQSVIAIAASTSPVPDILVPAVDPYADLLELFATVSDGRSGQGRDRPVAVVLALSTAAVVAGMRGYTAIAGWVADVPEPLRLQL
jgi:hypothetical protein